MDAGRQRCKLLLPDGTVAQAAADYPAGLEQYVQPALEFAAWAFKPAAQRAAEIRAAALVQVRGAARAAAALLLLARGARGERARERGPAGRAPPCCRVQVELNSSSRMARICELAAGGPALPGAAWAGAAAGGGERQHPQQRPPRLIEAPGSLMASPGSTAGSARGWEGPDGPAAWPCGAREQLVERVLRGNAELLLRLAS
jgi:hypothetical protein